MLIFSKNTYCRFLIFSVLAIFCFYQTIAAQSGRRPQKVTVSTEQNTSSESKQTENDDDETAVKVSSMKIVGEVQHNFAYYKSNDLDIALKEFISFFKLTSKKSTVELTKVGKMTYTEAKELAEKETETFVLWIGFSAKNDSYGNMYIDSVQYAVIKPKNAKILTKGEIKPGQNQIDMTQIPTVRRRAVSALSEMKNGARQITSILLRGGWLS